MRIVLVSAALLMLSACGGEPLPGGALPPPGMAARPPAPLVAQARPLPVVPAPAPAVMRPAPVEPVPLAAAPPPGVALAPAAPPPVIAARPMPPPAVVAARPARLPVTLVTTPPPPPRAAARSAPAVAVAAPPPPAPAIVPAVFVPRWAGWFTGHPPASPGRMTLSNFTFALAHVEALITPYPDCVVRAGMVPIDIKLPLNSTWTITTPPGRDVCWRRKVEGLPRGASLTLPLPGGWSPWNRVFTSFGHSVDARL